MPPPEEAHQLSPSMQRAHEAITTLQPFVTMAPRPVREAVSSLHDVLLDFDARLQRLEASHVQHG